MATIQEYVEQYLRGATALRAAVAGMSGEALRARPIDGKMSTLEVVAHIADFEPVLADRMKRVLALEKPTLMGADENLFLAKLRYQERDLQEELAVVDATRTAMARILRTVTDVELARTGTHTERGELTLERIVQMAIRHIEHHLSFIEAKKAALK
jgi:uncharacterized damage-inducible protein DinB